MTRPSSNGSGNSGSGSLPALPNLKQQKLLAKELLEAWRTGTPEAISRLRGNHQKYGDAKIDEMRASDLKLADAQHVIAREYGFSSWPRLKDHINQLTSRKRNDEVLEFIRAVTVGDAEDTRRQLAANEQLARLDVAEDNEHRALHFAVRKRDVQMVQLLVDHGADPDQGVYPHRDATSARALAHDRGYDELSEIFEARDEARRQETRCPNLTVTPAITEVADLVKEGNDDAVMECISQDSTLIDSCDSDGETVVHHAARWGRVDLLNRLIETGAHLNKMNVDGMRALDIAVRRPGSDEVKERCAVIGEVLLKQADIIVSLPTAVALGNLERVRQFADQEPEQFKPDVKRRCGLLEIAVQHNRLDTLKLLLELGCDPDDRHPLAGVPGRGVLLGPTTVPGSRRIAIRLRQRRCSMPEPIRMQTTTAVAIRFRRRTTTETERWSTCCLVAAVRWTSVLLCTKGMPSKHSN